MSRCAANTLARRTTSSGRWSVKILVTLRKGVARLHRVPEGPNANLGADDAALSFEGYVPTPAAEAHWLGVLFGMYQPPHNREERVDVIHDLIRDQKLGLLVSHGASGISANLVPFVLHEAGGQRGVLECHLARANDQWRELQASDEECLVVFQGPHAYVTPSWYPSKREHGKSVPTWNYMVVQARGRATVHEDRTWLRRHLEELTSENEARFEEPWRVDESPEHYLAAQLKGIVGVCIELTGLVGKWKLSQNRGVADRRGVIKGLMALGGRDAVVGEVMAAVLDVANVD